MFFYQAGHFLTALVLARSCVTLTIVILIEISKMQLLHVNSFIK